MRLFVAVWPPPEVHDALSRLPDPSEPGVRRVPVENRHITVRFIGEADPHRFRALLTDVDLPLARVRLGPVIERLGDRTIVIPAAGLDDLARSVHLATESVGDQDPRPFNGHLTIARTRPGAASSLLGTPFAAEFDVTEVALVRSDLGQAGAVYTTIDRFATGRRGSGTNGIND